MRSEPVSSLRGIGPKNALLLERLGIRTVFDLALHLPFRYEDRTRCQNLSELAIGEESLVRGCIVSSGSKRSRSDFFASIEDGSGRIDISFIHSYPGQAERLSEGRWIEAYGRVRSSRYGLEMVHPEYRVSTKPPEPHQPEYRPMYRSVAALTSARIQQWIEPSLRELNLLPVYIHEGLSLPAAIRIAHSPHPDKGLKDVGLARRRIALDELLGYHFVQRSAYRMRRQQQAKPLDHRRGLGRELLRNLGFKLTEAQRRVIREILDDLSQVQPMYRLLHGEVGSGKTVVAAFAAIRACENDVQTAFMAPTELLAEQHHRTLSEWLSPLGIEVGLLIGRQKKSVRAARARAIAAGTDLVVVGTHALLQRSVSFRQLGLVVVDEQHRFGVHQRMQLREKGRLPHQLIMTATPIPRTLTMSMYANMDVSTLDQIPPSRKPVATRMIPSSRRRQVLSGVARQVACGRQVYWVVPAISDSDNMDMRSVEAVLEEVRSVLPRVKSEMLHGRLKEADKTKRMSAFRNGKLDLIVTTTVIEVGVDVSNASVIVIDNSERMGLAQLHQLRGRVGRGESDSYCVLLHDTPLSEEAKKRLSVLVHSNNGFEIAETDLKLRGGGDLLGVRQSGDGDFRVFDPIRDGDLIEEIQELGERLQEQQSDLVLEILATWAPEHRDYSMA